MIKQKIVVHEEPTTTSYCQTQTIPEAMKIVTELYNVRIGDTLIKKAGGGELLLESFNTENPPMYMGQPCILKCKSINGAISGGTYLMGYAIKEIDWDKTLVGDGL